MQTLRAQDQIPRKQNKPPIVFEESKFSYRELRTILMAQLQAPFSRYGPESNSAQISSFEI